MRSEAFLSSSSTEFRFHGVLWRESRGTWRGERHRRSPVTNTNPSGLWHPIQDISQATSINVPEQVTLRRGLLKSEQQTSHRQVSSTIDITSVGFALAHSVVLSQNGFARERGRLPSRGRGSGTFEGSQPPPTTENASAAEDDRRVWILEVLVQGPENLRGHADIPFALSRHGSSSARWLPDSSVQKHFRLAHPLRGLRFRGQGRPGDVLLASHHLQHGARV